MTGLWLVAATLVALVVQTTLAYAAGVSPYVNLPVAVVVFFALLSGPGMGLLAGTVAGLAQDVLSGSPLGVNGFASSLVGVLSGFVGQQFIVSGFGTRFVVFMLGSLLQGLCVVGLYSLIEGRGVRVTPVMLATQGVLNAVVGVVAFSLVESLPEAARRRRPRGLVR